MGINAASEKKLLKVKPALVKVVRRAAEIGPPFQVVQGNRTQAEQNSLYAQGRTRPGPIVTWTRKSRHIGGGAIDFAALVSGKISWNEKLYPAIAEAFKQAAAELQTAITWGGDWTTKDWGHIELGGVIPTITGTKVVMVTAPRQVLKKGMTGGDVPVAQLKLRTLKYYTALVDGVFGPKTDAAVKAFQKSIGLKVDGIVGPITWDRLEAIAAKATQEAVQPQTPPTVSPDKKPISGAVATSVAVEQIMNWPQEAIKLYESLGWSRIQAIALTANLMWESGGNRTNTIKFDAKGDRGKSHGAGQWNETAGRFGLLKDFATRRGKEWTDPETQLLFLDHELHTTERRAGVLLRAAETIEDAIAACIKVWRPSIPHTEKRLAIAKKLMGG